MRTMSRIDRGRHDNDTVITDEVPTSKVRSIAEGVVGGRLA